MRRGRERCSVTTDKKNGLEVKIFLLIARGLVSVTLAHDGSLQRELIAAPLAFSVFTTHL